MISAWICTSFCFSALLMFPRLDGERIFSLTSSLLSYSQLERPVTRAKKKKKKKRKRIFQKKKMKEFQRHPRKKKTLSLVSRV